MVVHKFDYRGIEVANYTEDFNKLIKTEEFESTIKRICTVYGSAFDEFLTNCYTLLSYMDELRSQDFYGYEAINYVRLNLKENSLLCPCDENIDLSLSVELWNGRFLFTRMYAVVDNGKVDIRERGYVVYGDENHHDPRTVTTDFAEAITHFGFTPPKAKVKKLNQEDLILLLED